MPFQIIRNDITKVEADIIVNTANPNAIIGSGTDYAIYHAAGKDALLAERKKIGKIERGEIAVTSAYNLKAKYIIHAVGSGWLDGKHNEKEIVRSCYSKSLKKAVELSAQSIAFPLISSGNYGFPKDLALNIALSEISKFLLFNELNVILVVFDTKSFELSHHLTEKIDAYIDSQTAMSLESFEYDWETEWEDVRKERKEQEKHGIINNIDTTSFDPEFIESYLKNKDDNFRDYLFKLIAERNLDDITVYKRANLDRRLFSQIRCKDNYQPNKKTALALAIALELDMRFTLLLLSKAGFTINKNDTLDLIVSFYITNKKYDIHEINSVLFLHGQPLLGNQA